MALPSPKIVLVDSSFFFALLTRDDNWHDDAVAKQKWLYEHRAMVPWPVLYETVNRRFLEDEERAASFDRILRRPGIERVDDRKYRDGALDRALGRSERNGRRPSLVDTVLRAILEDGNVRVDAMLTFDYRDFAAVCAARRVDLL